MQLFRQFKKTQPKKELLTGAAACMTAMTVCLICSLITFSVGGYSYAAGTHLLKAGSEGFLSFISLFSAIALTMMTTYRGGINKKLAFLWASYILMMAPLFEVSPIGPRCFFAPYTVLILIVCEVMKYITIESADRSKQLQKYTSAISAVLIVLSTAFYFRIFIPVYQAEQQRNQHIQDEIAAGHKTVELSHLPYENWIWKATITGDDDLWEYRYKLFYGIPKDVDIIVVEN